MNQQEQLHNIRNGLKPRAVIVYVALAVFILGCGLGVYFGIFIGMRVFGGG